MRGFSGYDVVSHVVSRCGFFGVGDCVCVWWCFVALFGCFAFKMDL